MPDHQSSSAAAASKSSVYALDNSAKEASSRFDALAAMHDPGTIRHLEQVGVSSGWRCLEIGGGGGSIAAWLAERVGPTGHVLVTDIDPRFLESLQATLPASNLEVRRHNIVNDSLPEAAFDLVHSRLVLLHLPEREKALARMIAALKPGGWLIDEEYDTSHFTASNANSAESPWKTVNATRRVMQDRGADDHSFGRQLFSHLRAHGLVDVAAEGSLRIWHAGSPGASLLRANFEQLHRTMIDAGYITQQEYEQDLALLDNPAFTMPSPIMWTVSGRRPSKP